MKEHLTQNPGGDEPCQPLTTTAQFNPATEVQSPGAGTSETPRIEVSREDVLDIQLRGTLQLNGKLINDLARVTRERDEARRMLEGIRVMNYYSDFKKAQGERDALKAQVAELQEGRSKYFDLYAAQCEETARVKVDNDALRKQVHDFCHDLHENGPVTLAEFCAGCEAFQVKHFGASPIATLRAENEALKKEVAEFTDLGANVMGFLGNLLNTPISARGEFAMRELEAIIRKHKAIIENACGREEAALDECSRLQTENASLRAELEEAKKEIAGFHLRCGTGELVQSLQHQLTEAKRERDEARIENHAERVDFLETMLRHMLRKTMKGGCVTGDLNKMILDSLYTFGNEPFGEWKDVEEAIRNTEGRDIRTVIGAAISSARAVRHKTMLKLRTERDRALAELTQALEQVKELTALNEKNFIDSVRLAHQLESATAKLTTRSMELAQAREERDNRERNYLLSNVDDKAIHFAETLPLEKLRCSKCKIPLVALSSLQIGRCLWCREPEDTK